MTQFTIAELTALAAAAHPINDDDWGTQRQIDAENAFWDACGDLGADFERYSLKATSDEALNEALRILTARAS